MKHATIEDAPAVLNTNDKAMWVLGFNDGQEATIKRLAAGVSVEPVASDNPDFMTIPVEYQYAYPDGTWRCSNGDAINGMKPTAARALYARKDSQ